MKLKDLQDAMIAAMKAKDKPRKDSISALVSAVKKAGIDAGCRDDIPEDMVNQVVLKELCTSQQKVDTFFIFYTLKTEHSTPYIVLVSNSLMSMQVFLH